MAVTDKLEGMVEALRHDPGRVAGQVGLPFPRRSMNDTTVIHRTATFGVRFPTPPVGGRCAPAADVVPA